MVSRDQNRGPYEPVDRTQTGVPRTTYSPHDEPGGTTTTQSTESSSGTSARDKAMNAAHQAQDKATETAHIAQERAGHAMHTAEQKVDQQRDTVAGSLDNVAGTIRQRADSIPGGERTTQMAETAANKLQTTADYVREHDVNDMMTDVESFVRSHPAQSLAIAAAAGFLFGRAIRG